MILSELELMNFRNCRSHRLIFDAPRVIFAGRNGSGKSNLLESIFYLSILRSFRNAGVREMIMLGERSFILRGRIRRKGYSGTVEVEQTVNNTRRLFIDGVPVRRSSDFIWEFRTVAFVPEDKFVTAGSSSCRRRFFDMLISVMKPEYLSALQRYAAALAQRNAALRNQASEGAVAAFEPELASAAAVIAPARAVFADNVCQEVNTLFGGERFGIAYMPEYPVSAADYLKKLERERSRDRKRGFTSFGIQTDEFVFTLDGKNLRSFGSNGQQRLVALYLKMAEFALVRRQAGCGVAALVDDVTGELDNAARERFFQLLDTADQAFFTFTECPASHKDAQQVTLPL